MQILFAMHSVYCQVKKNKNGSSQYSLWIDSNKVQSLNKKMKTCYLFFRTFGGWSFFFCQCVQKMFILLCIEIKSIEKYLITQKKLMVVLTCMGHLQPRLMIFFKKNLHLYLVFLMYLMITLDVERTNLIVLLLNAFCLYVSIHLFFVTNVLKTVIIAVWSPFMIKIFLLLFKTG